MKKIMMIVSLVVFVFPLTVFATTTNTSVSNTVDWKSIGTLVASTIAALATVFNIWFQRKNHREAIKAQVLAKARIEWMKEVREVFTRFVERSADYEFSLMLFSRKSFFEEDDKNRIELIRDIDKAQSYFWASLYHLATYFPDSKDGRNQRVRDTFDILARYLDEYHTHTLEGKSKFEFTSELELLEDEEPSIHYSLVVDNVTQSLAEYLKEEWERAKSEAIGKKK